MSEEYSKKFKEKFVANMKKKGVFDIVPEECAEEFTDLIFNVVKKEMPFFMEESEELANVVLEKSKLNVENKVNSIMNRIMKLSDKFNKIKDELICSKDNVLKWRENIGCLKEEIMHESINIKKIALGGMFPDEIFDHGTFINIDKSFKKMQVPRVKLKSEYTWTFFCYFHLEILKIGVNQLILLEKTLDYFSELEKLCSQEIFYEQIDRSDVDQCMDKARKINMNQLLDSEFFILYDYCKNHIKSLQNIEEKLTSDLSITNVEKLDLKLLISNYQLVYSLLSTYKVNEYRFNYEFDYAGFLDEIGIEINQENKWIYSLIEMGESSNLEFKSSLLHDYKTNKKNNDLVDVIGREIVAFMNADGGKILIGVNDDGKILGIEQDYSYVHKNSSDGFLLRLDDLIGSKIGLGVSSLIDSKLIEIEEKLICVIEIKKSCEDVFYNKEDFYIRMGASIKKLSTKEYNDHKKQQEKAT